jgi:type I restriction enzyme M protein
VLFESGAAAVIRRRLLESWNTHTILRLPTGIFYAHGVKANVLFFDFPGKRLEERGREVWFYDLRRNSRFSFTTNRLQRRDLDEFVTCYKSRRSLTKGFRLASHKRWRAFPIESVLATKDCNLDLARGDGVYESPSGSANHLDEIATLIADDLRKALANVLEMTE